MDSPLSMQSDDSSTSEENESLTLKSAGVLESLLWLETEWEEGCIYILT
jgi:hypothetical protein